MTRHLTELKPNVWYTIEPNSPPYTTNYTVLLTCIMKSVNTMLKTQFGKHFQINHIGKHFQINHNTRMFRYSPMFGLEMINSYNSKYYENSIKIVDCDGYLAADDEYLALIVKDPKQPWSHRVVVDDLPDANTYGLEHIKNKENDMENIIKDYETNQTKKIRDTYQLQINEIEAGNKFNKFVAKVKNDFTKTFKLEIEQSAITPKLVIETIYTDLELAEKNRISVIKEKMNFEINEVNKRIKTVTSLINSADNYEQKRAILNEFGILDYKTE